MKATVALHLLALGLAMTSSLGRASMEGSKHDFRSPGSESATTGSLKDICGFCHTPVGVETIPDGPLWSPQTDEQTFGNIASFGTSNLEGNPMGPVSLTCLTCHDGTQASDASYAGGGFADGGTVQVVEGGLAVTEAALFSPLDTLSNHPVHVPYAGGACTGVESDCNPAATARRNDDFGIARFDMINSTKSWWVDTAEGVPGIRDKSDMILYPRDFGGTVGPAVECGSCHDPHDGRERPVSFLRMPAGDSSICLTCHVNY